MMEEDGPEPDRSEQIEQAAEPEQEGRNPDEPPGGAPANVRALQRRRPRVRQLQRGFWIEIEDEDLCALLNATLDYVRQEGGDQWNRIDVNGDLGKSWAARESASADIKLILCSTSARRMKKPQPHMGPADVPIRKSFLLLADDKVLTTDWEMWANQAPSSQVRPLMAQQRRLYVVTYGTEVGEALEEHDRDPWRVHEEARLRQWQALPRELKLAVKRLHTNLGHADNKSMLRALRITKASEVALKAVKLFRCPECEGS